VKKQHSFRQKAFFYFISVFFVFTVIVLLFQLNREKQYKISLLENTLEKTTEIVHNYIKYKHLYKDNTLIKDNALKHLIPEKNIRISIINKKGKVLYDSFVDDYEKLENHLNRPEIQKALFSEKGGNIRHSKTTGQDFYYYAHNYGDYFIRAAKVYDVKIQHFLRGNRFFIFFMLGVFLIAWFITNTITKRLSISLTKLKDFSIQAGKNKPIDETVDFPDNELGEIGAQIVKLYSNLQKAKDEISLEKERIFNHLSVLNEGIAFFKPNRTKMLANSHFIQYISIISDTSTISAEHIFDIPEFQKLNNFLDETLNKTKHIKKNKLPQIKFTIHKNERFFKVSCIVFADRSFEILITDITRPEKRKLLKQQLTSNIAHELKTPLSSIKGYLETLLRNPQINKEKQHYFIKRAYSQAERLNLLLNDISLLNNIEDAGELFEIKPVIIKNIVADVIENLKSRLEEKNIRYEIYINETVVVHGNDSLLSSVFQNLIENTINYAGENIVLKISNYMEDDKFYYFSYSDSGIGIPEQHLHRIFERFYRIDSGRTRKMGGTGLGLSIVKNAILLHKGKISVRNKAEGGIEFLFTLAKH